MNDISERVEGLVAAFAKGEIVVVTDDDDRENEGDLFVAASLCSPEKMAFIIRHTSGIVCAPLAQEEAKRLHLAPMVALNDAPLGTAFTVSVDVRHGLTTGISAEERTNTVRALANDIIVMRAGKVVEKGPAAKVFDTPESDYTKALIAAAFQIATAPEGVVAE